MQMDSSLLGHVLKYIGYGPFAIDVNHFSGLRTAAYPLNDTPCQLYNTDFRKFILGLSTFYVFLLSRKNHEALTIHHKKLSSGALLSSANEQCLIQDSGAGFYLIDGDSLILEAMGTKTWKYGQHLHLFYIVEMYLFQLRQNGCGTFEIVFFSDMEKVWYKDIIVRIFRVSLINHLRINCSLTVHCEWKDPFSGEWLEFLAAENPSFILVHDGYNKAKSTNTALKILAYKCLAHNIDVAFISNVKQQSSKLYAVYVKSHHRHSSSTTKRYLQEVWSCLLEYLNAEFLHISGGEENNDTVNLKDKLFIESLTFYWNDLKDDEKGSSVVKQYLNRCCRYFAALSTCTLSERISIARESDSHNYRGMITEDNQLFGFVLCILKSLCTVSPLSIYNDPESFADILDLAVYFQLFECTAVSSIISSDEVQNRYLALIELSKSKGINIEVDHIGNVNLTERPLDCDSPVEEPSLIEIKSRLADEYAGETKRSLNVGGNAILTDDEEVFGDIYDWKSGEPLKDDIDFHTQKSLSKIPSVRCKQLRDVQKYNDFIAMYGKSLQNSCEPTLITKNEKENKKVEKVKQKQRSKKQGNQKNMRETIIEENKKKLLEESRKKVATQWKSKKGEIGEIADSAVAIKKVTDFIRKSECAKVGYEEPMVVFMQLQYDIWKKSCADNHSNISNLADLVHTMHQILQSENTSDTMKLKIAKYFKRTGFEDVASMITQMIPECKPSMLKVADKCPVDMPYNIFQMSFMGHLMKRQERADPDPRVTGFIPDTWQRELLDVVDKNESAIIVAPTSSGKTFCSFYCMEKVLRGSDTNVVVYVSPTKALVNQVQATIYSRYNKNMPAGMSVVGVLTREYQHNALTSQILVTIPQCLEILLLSPKRQQWASKLQYVIFDEIHCIGGENGGEVWEHLITLIRCPFLALSATIGNPDFFHSWLRCVNKFKEGQYNSENISQKAGKDKVNMKHSVKLVVYSERYSDINKNIYLPQTDEIVSTHPCVFLESHCLSVKGFPCSLSLSPKESYELWLASKFTFRDDPDKLNNLEKWCPIKYFGNELYITKQQAREYEISLKKQLEELLQGNEMKAQLLVTYFREMLPAHCLSGSSSDRHFTMPGISEREFDIYNTFPSLVERLRAEDKLPVIVFMNNRLGIEKLTKTLKKHVVQKLDDVQAKMSQVHARQSEADKIAKKATKGRKNRDSDGEEMEDHMQEYLSGEVNRNKLQIQKKENACKFITQGTLSPEDREKFIGQLKERMMLEYGIGYHHAGCNIKHKEAVEILFRSEYAQIVAATATLALGIHMPCKTVVFVGDDYKVDALNYRQMSGRSGRRGFDNLGNVVFYGVPLPKISNLINADISKLEGQFPVNCTIVLRLLLLAANSADDDDAHMKAMTVLSHPFITHQSPSLQNQLRYYFLFVTDFLIRQAIIDENGIPLGFSGLISHIHYHEPGNIAFVNLLKKGVFHPFCKPSRASEAINFGFTCKKCKVTPIPGNRFTCSKCMYDYSLCSKCFGIASFHRVRKDEHLKSDFHENEANLKYTYPENTLRLLVCILSHIFCKRQIPNFRLKFSAENISSLRQRPRFASKVLLDTIPDDVYQAITTYNESVQSIFGNYLSVVSMNVPKGEQVTLPISKKSWERSSETNSTGNNNTSAVDPFVQLSGCSNLEVKRHCLDTEEIRRLIPRQIYMDFNFIPALEIGIPKNAYALDFFEHVSKTAINKDNWIPIEEVYDSLNDFKLLIRSISTAMEQLGPEDGDDHVIWAFKHLDFEYSQRFSLAYPKSKKGL